MSLTILVNGALGLLPVLAFLAMLIQSDTFKLVRRNYVAMLIVSGAGAALTAYFAGKALMRETGVNYDAFIQFTGPLLEEALKALIVMLLIRSNRIGFVLDAAIAGFAIGAGFALVENYFYLRVIGEGNSAIWVVRGFGAAIMHGGATALFAILAQALTPQDGKGSPLRFAPGFLAAFLVHALFNRFLDYPVTSTIVMMIGLAASLSLILHRDRQSIDQWLTVDFDEYRKLLLQIRSGAFGDDGFGKALQSLRIRFDPTEVAEIMRYAELHTELVLFAEDVLKAQARGEAIEVPAAIKEKLAHFHYLEERIGGAVRLALRRHLKFSRYEFFQLYKLQRDAGQIVAKEHAFNTDLLLDEADREMAKRDYPDLFFALNNPGLTEAFAQFDRRANQSKQRSRRSGVAAVLLATAAVFAASAEHLYQGLPPWQLRAIAAFGGVLLAAGVGIGVFGVIQRGRKARWLADRLATERLRQFHFQYYVANAESILAGAKNQETARAYVERRAGDLEQFKMNYLASIDEVLHAIVNEEDFGEGILQESAPPEVLSTDPHLDQYFSAYGRLRFDLQLNYCNHVLRESKGFWKRSAIRQAQAFETFGLAGVLGVLGLYGVILVGAFWGVERMQDDLVHVLAAWAAIVALAARTFEGGLQPKREVERMRQYRIQLRRVNARFRSAESPKAKIAAMQELEKLTYQEMAIFLKSSYEAQFVM